MPVLFPDRLLGPEGAIMVNLLRRVRVFPLAVAVFFFLVTAVTVAAVPSPGVPNSAPMHAFPRPSSFSAPPAPLAAKSYYVTTTNTALLHRLGCRDANSLPYNFSGLTVLDFGAQRLNPQTQERSVVLPKYQQDDIT